MSDDIQHTKITRRRFSAIALGSAGAIAVGGVAVLTLTDDDHAPARRGDGTPIGAFGVEHDGSVYVTMTNGAEFVVEVKERGSGTVLERHEGVTAESLASLTSDYVAIAPID